MKKKNLNNRVAKKVLATEIGNALTKAEYDRWAQSEEGMRYLARQAEEAALEAKRESFKPGQLVWRKLYGWNENTLKPDIFLGDLCCKVLDVKTYTVGAEILFVVDKDGMKLEEFDDFLKGDHLSFYIDDLEKHVAKGSGNVWWKNVG